MYNLVNNYSTYIRREFKKGPKKVYSPNYVHVSFSAQISYEFRMLQCLPMSCTYIYPYLYIMFILYYRDKTTTQQKRYLHNIIIV